MCNECGDRCDGGGNGKRASGAEPSGRRKERTAGVAARLWNVILLWNIAVKMWLELAVDVWRVFSSFLVVPLASLFLLLGKEKTTIRLMSAAWLMPVPAAGKRADAAKEAPPCRG